MSTKNPVKFTLNTIVVLQINLGDYLLLAPPMNYNLISLAFEFIILTATNDLALSSLVQLHEYNKLT
jgi:hypothetical protein